MAAPRPAPAAPRAVASRRHGDVLVLGSSLEAAVAAVKLQKDGWKVLWVGDAPAAMAKLGEFHVPATPALAPSPSNAPALTSLLADVGAEGDARKTWRSVTLQLLGDRRREDVAPEVHAGLAEAAESLNTLSADTLNLGYLGRRRLAARTAELGKAVDSAESASAEVVRAIDTVLGETPASALEPVRIAAAPHQIAGGMPAIVKLLREGFTELGGATFPLSAPLETLELDLSGVRCVLPGGNAHSARLAIVGLDDAQVSALLPENERVLAPKLTVETTPLLRLSLVVKARGLPRPLGPAAFVDGRWLLERSVLEPGVDCLNVFWRHGDRDPKAEADEALARLRTLLPWFERHLVIRSEPLPVPFCARAADRPTRPKWRVLQALGPQAGLGGIEGAARLGLAIAARAKQLAPRKDVLAQERER